MNAWRIPCGVSVLALSYLLLRGPVSLGADDMPLPAQLTEVQRTNLKKFLSGHEKPKRFIPEKARVIGTAAEGMDLETPPDTPIKEYLAAIIPHRSLVRDQAPDKVDVYWVRPNPRRGQPGVTVRRTVDLATGEAVGAPDVLFNHATPLAKEELSEAVEFARKKVAAVAALYEGGAEVAVAPLLQVITATGQADGGIGDRVVSLQFQRKGGEGRVHLLVNLTRQSVRDPNAP